MTFGRPGATSCISTSRPRLRMWRGDRLRDPAFARRARHERRIDGIDRNELAQQRDAGIHGGMRPVLCPDGSEGSGRGDHRCIVWNRPGDRRSTRRGRRRRRARRAARRSARRGGERDPRRRRTRRGGVDGRDVGGRRRLRLVGKAMDVFGATRHHGLQRRLRLLRHGRRDRSRRHAADDGRQFLRHVSTARAPRCRSSAARGAAISSSSRRSSAGAASR